MDRFFSALLLLLLPSLSTSVPSDPFYFDNNIDHEDPTSGTYSQRFYQTIDHFKGPGNPIFLVFGGEGAVPPSTGLFYPYINEQLAANLSAAVLQPEHRFYGASQPAPKTNDNLKKLMTPQQALNDAANLVTSFRAQAGCATTPGEPGYCPVIAVGGSYPGFLSFSARLTHPNVFDASYAASAPVHFYAQQVDGGDYYELITKSAERSMAGCPESVSKALSDVQADLQDGDYCFDMSSQLPSGKSATISSGDWSGVGTGDDGEMWDWQTCSLLVERIGFDAGRSMFLQRDWTMEWMAEHCSKRFEVTPDPLKLANDWGFADIESTGLTRVLFTNGLNDGWAVGSVTTVSDIANAEERDLIVMNFDNGAHHSDLSHSEPGDDDTLDIQKGHADIQDLMNRWVKDIMLG
ncbi:hypothetical protein TrRE_jg1825 [Triparma retinervis]|uniref:Uncharacterized protein n=1 Tax=Triparma retinervis TaxID=2557542 RepID=A0A9W7AUP6_9STRA|nr:hypothetical protein TrRE_jg1825 [Triparma retinervis]